MAITNKKGAWWIEVIKGKYGEKDEGWISCSPRKGYGLELWKVLRKWGHLISNQFSFIVNDKKRTKFWNNRWYGDLDVAFPSLFSIASAKEA